MAEQARNKKTDAGKPAALAATAAAVGSAVNLAFAQGSDKIKVGLIGCGGRGTGAVRNCMEADPGVEVIAVADLFEKQARGAKAGLERDGKFKDRTKIPDDHVFWGFDACKKLLATQVQVVLQAEPPGFRPRHFKAAIEAGKHVFFEKPVAVDPAGARIVLEAARLADQKKLNVVCGTQRRHEFSRVELMKRIHDGAMGELIGGQCYWLGGGIWYKMPDQGTTEFDWQCHNWYHFCWLSGDQICEQHIHNIDVMNWCFQGPPKNFLGIGGRVCRDYSSQAKQVSKLFNDGDESKWEKYNGDIWDHIGTELEYPNGARVLSMGGHGGAGRGGERLVGTKGFSDCAGSITGENAWRYSGPHPNGMVQEHADLLKSIREGKPLNEGVRIAESTLTAIGGRMSAYTGRAFSWNWLLKESKLDLWPGEDKLKSGPGIFYPIPSGHDPLV